MMRSIRGAFKHRHAMRSPPRSPGRLREEDAAAHAARVAEARAAYSRLSRAGGELNRELRTAARTSAPATAATAPAAREDALRGLDSLAVAAGRPASPRKPPPSSPPGDISAGPHEGWLGSVLARREEEEEDDDDDDDDDVELTEEEVRAFREYRRTEELHARLGFALTDKALSPMRGEAPERRRNPNPSSSSPNSAGKKKKRSSPAAEADRAARATRAVLADMAAANKSLLDAAAASPDAFRLTPERTRRVMRDIGLASSDEAADEIIELTSGSAFSSERKKKKDDDTGEDEGLGDDEDDEDDEDEDGDPAWYDEDDPAWSMDVEAKLAAIAAAREEARVRRERLDRLMGDAEARMGTRKVPPGGENVDEKIASLKAAAAAREREFEKLGIGNVARGETRGTNEESKKSFSRADADASIARLEKAVAEFKALGPLTSPSPMTPETAAEIEAEVMARLPKFPPSTPPLPEFDYDPKEVDELLTQLEAEEAERAAAKKKRDGEQKQQQKQHHHHQQQQQRQQQQQQQQRSPISPRSPSRGARPPLPPDVSAHRTALVLEALAEADLEVRDDPPDGDVGSPDPSDVLSDPATPNALKPEHADGANHTLPLDVTDRPGPGDEAIRAKVAELRETMRSCAELIARHAARDENPAKTKLVSDLAHVLRAASEKEARESAATKEGDETGRGAGDERTATSETDRSLPEFTGRVPDAVRETRELIRDMEERVKATAARIHDSLTKPPRPFEIEDGDPPLTVEGMLKGLDRLNAERLDHRPYAAALANASNRTLDGADSDAEDSPGLTPRWANADDASDSPSPSEWDREAWERERAALRDRLREEFGLSDRFGEDEPPVPERFLEDETGKLKHVRDFESLMDYAFD